MTHQELTIDALNRIIIIIGQLTDEIDDLRSRVKILEDREYEFHRGDVEVSS